MLSTKNYLNNEENWMAKCEDIRLPELPDEIWVEIMWKLSIKPLHLCKCVSKTWYSFVSHILSCQKGLELPPYGILFMTREFWPISDPNISNRGWQLGYLSFGNCKIALWPMSEEPEPKPKSAIVGITGRQHTHKSSSLGNLTIDFSCLVPDPKWQGFWTMHRGLVLISSIDTLTFYVYNPATKEKFVLPVSPYLAQRDPLSKPLGSLQGAIINLSDCLLSTQCNFRVIRFSKKGRRSFAEVYSSNKNQWFQSEFCLDKAVFKAKWTLCGSVIVDNTVFFFTDKRHVVGIKLLSGEKLSAYCLHLPQPIRKGLGESTLLYGSQGCLYLSYNKFHDLWIWKHDGRSLDSQAWIPQLIFKNSGLSLCQPVAQKYLRQIVGTNDYAEPVIMHPEAPVVFIHMLSSIFAFHLLNDTVEKIAELKETKIVSAGYVCMYSPCFASFGLSSASKSF